MLRQGRLIALVTFLIGGGVLLTVGCSGTRSEAWASPGKTDTLE